MSRNGAGRNRLTVRFVAMRPPFALPNQAFFFGQPVRSRPLANALRVQVNLSSAPSSISPRFRLLAESEVLN